MEEGSLEGQCHEDTKATCDIKHQVMWSMNAVSLQEILLVPWKGLKENQWKTNISAMYRTILMVEYLPRVWTTWKICVCKGGDSLVWGVILTAQVKLDAVAMCNFISYILKDI